MDSTTTEKASIVGEPAGLTHSDTMALKVERCRDRWNDLKRRLTPKSYPYAGPLFLIIIIIAAGTVVSGWYGLTKDTINHEAEPSMAPTASILTTERPAPPGLRESVRFTSTSDGLLETYGAVEMALRVKPTVGLSIGEAPLARAVSEETMITEVSTMVTTTDTYFVTTTMIKTVTIPLPPACTTCTAENPHHTSTPSSPSTTTATTVSSSDSNDAPLTAISTTKTSEPQQPEAPPASDTSSGYTMTGIMYCSWPSRPNIYTLCPVTHTQAPGMLDPTDVPAVASAAVPARPTNPFAMVRVALSYLWTWRFPLLIADWVGKANAADTTAIVPNHNNNTGNTAVGEGRKQGTKRHSCDDDDDDIAEETKRNPARATELLCAQRRLILSQQSLLEDQDRIIHGYHQIMTILRIAIDDTLRKIEAYGKQTEEE